ncbi:MAG: ATP-binding cassette domain-containing protein, partial [Defluviitaleaceae bacterium]|nr:ATP-binding cassette domain-containing protein [Defluviitaleaceae bacterium]
MFQIDLKNSKTIYDQLIENFARLINSRLLKPGSKVPSIREMAIMQTVNPNVVKKAYLELEHKGFFHTEQGREWFISTKPDQAGIYGRIQADMRELMLRGEDKATITSILGMEEKAFIKVKNIHKYYDDLIALEEFNMSIKKGSIYGLAGTNGSGKTTVIKLLAGLYQPDEGTVLIDGISAYNNAHEKVIGYMPDELYFLPQYNMSMLRKFFANKHKDSWNDKRYEHLLKIFELDDEQKINTFSTGMQKQAGFIFAISSMPDILLLDETIDGLDPVVRKHVFRQIISDVATRHMTVLMTSHNMKELDGICDTVGIIDEGSMVLEQELDDLKSSLHKVHVAFGPEVFDKTNPYDKLDILHFEEMGFVHELVVRGKHEDIASHINRFNPTIYNHMPLSLEE